MSADAFKKIGHLRNVQAFRAHVAGLGLSLPCDEQVLHGSDSPLAQPLHVDGRTLGNRWCVHPMEGWDGTRNGEPSEHTLRRWRHFGESGAKLIWGGEAFAVVEEGRANPNQLGIVDDDYGRAEVSLRRLLDHLLTAHREKWRRTDDLLVGLQLTHSGRFCRPFDQTLWPQIAYHHPLLDSRFGIDPNDNSVVLSDDDLRRLVDRFIRAARLAHNAGFGFVDVKACHGYLGHELLSAFVRPGPYGGSFENRTRFCREIIDGIRAECPKLMIGVRFSAFDNVPFHAQIRDGKPGQGLPAEYKSLLPYRYAFGCNQNNPLDIDLTEPIQFVRMLSALGVRLINVSAGSPYYNPHIQRPAMFPPSDGYQPPEDPLIGVARQIDVTRQIKQACPDAIVVGSGYSYLQEYLPHVAQAVVREGWADVIGIGRMVLSYWDMPGDAMRGEALKPGRICRTFSDCTSAPRSGIISGCYPLDPHYKDSSEHAQLKQRKAAMRKALKVLP